MVPWDNLLRKGSPVRAAYMSMVGNVARSLVGLDGVAGFDISEYQYIDN
jgi:hypothetical protein